MSLFFFFNDTATTEIYTLSLHDALPICGAHRAVRGEREGRQRRAQLGAGCDRAARSGRREPLAVRYPRSTRRLEIRSDRKSTRLNSSHSQISYAVFCLKKKKRPTGDAVD